ncbi:GFA family protein [Thalassotalea sp. G2M2-11]|uniref:GFA family protein n=1 Tax=Thalassotalea sp. G2M2-11 TaxID=2787627 RepID=UPI0019D03FDF|nr:GFA family protein [Thalassotalea sp. G2M2-11]
MTESNVQRQGGCSCGYIRYQIAQEPLITHCCHCRYCQRQTGTAFALNALFDANKVSLLEGSVEEIMTDSPSGRGQNIARCPKCHIALWSNYFMGGIKQGIRFIRVGTLDEPDQLPPDVHIYTSTKQPWVQLPDSAAIFERFYDFEKVWSKENNAVRKAMLAKVK